MSRVRIAGILALWVLGAGTLLAGARAAERAESWKRLPLPGRLIAPGVTYQQVSLTGGPVHVIWVLGLPDNDIVPWLGTRVQQGYRDTAGLAQVVKDTGGVAGVSAAFAMTGPRTAQVGGHVVRDRKNLVCPLPPALARGCPYFAVHRGGRFTIGETHLTTAAFLRQHGDVRHLLGGGGWLVRKGALVPEATLVAQGFETSVELQAPRVVVGVRPGGHVACLAAFERPISVAEAAHFALSVLGAQDALFLDAGGIVDMEIPSLPAVSATKQGVLNVSSRNPRVRVAAALLVRAGAK